MNKKASFIFPTVIIKSSNDGDFLGSFTDYQRNNKPPTEKKDYSNLIGLAIAGTAAGLGHKAKLDFSKLYDKAKDFNSAVKTRAFSQKSPMAQGIAAAKAYADKGQDLINSKILGMPVPYVGLQTKATLDGLMENNFNPIKTLLKYLKGGDHIPAKHSHSHYTKFKGANKEDLYAYNIYGDLYKGVSPEAEKIIRSYSPENVASSLLELKRRGMHEDYAQARTYFRNLRNKYAGSSPMGSSGGNAQNYENVAHLVMPTLIGSASLARNVSGATAGLYGLKEIKEQLEKQSTTKEELAAGAGVGAGVTLAASGIHDIRRPLRVGVSWSELPRHGDGHKNPGISMYETIERIRNNNPEFKNLELVKAIRDKTNNYDARALKSKFDLFADSGMGPTSEWDWDKGDSPGPGKRNAKIKIAPGGFVGYMTDVGSAGSPHDGFKLGVDSPIRRLAQKFGLKDNYIKWGPTDVWNQNLEDGNPHKQKLFYDQFNVHAVSNQGMPTLTEKASDILQGLQSKSRDEVIADALRNPALDEHQKSLLKNLGDKKLIFVTGSGRGDYVGTRLRELRRELRRAGLQDKYQLAGMLGGSADVNPISRSLQKDKNLLLFKRLPQDLYIGLPGVADFHDISTGTSSLMEALGSKANLGVRNNWGALKEKERKLFERLTRRGIEIPEEFKSEHSMVALDDWNKGNRIFAKNQPSVRGINDTKQMIRFLESLKPEDYKNAEKRSLRQFHANNFAKDNLSSKLLEFLKRQKKIKNVTGGIKGLAGLGLGTVSLSSLLNSKDKQLPSPTKAKFNLTEMLENLKN